MYIPQLIQKMIENKEYTIDQTGMSGSSILMFDDCVLKIQPFNKEVESEIDMMQWLAHTNLIPKVILHITENNKSYLLMTRMDGKMSCDRSYKENNEVLVDVLVQGLKKLWSIDIKDCPCDWTLKNKLKLILILEVGYEIT